MRISHFSFALMLLAGLSNSNVVLAQQSGGQPVPNAKGLDDTPAPGVPSFNDLDKAHKRRLYRSDLPKDVEALKPLRAHFRDADINGDGALTPDEYYGYFSKPTP